MADAAIDAAPAPAEVPAPADAPAPAADAPAPPASASGAADPAAFLKQYGAEFQSAGDEYKAKALVLQGSAQELVASLQASLLAQRDAALVVLSNTADASAQPAKVLSIFLWSSVLVLAASASFSLGANLLHYFVGAFLGSFGAAFAALVAVPLYAYHYSLKGSSLADKDARFALLGYASLAGLLLISAFSHFYIYAEPYAFILPAVAGSAYYYAAPAVSSSRVNLLAASLGNWRPSRIGLGVVPGLRDLLFAVGLRGAPVHLRPRCRAGARLLAGVPDGNPLRQGSRPLPLRLARAVRGLGSRQVGSPNNKSPLPPLPFRVAHSK